MLRRAEGPSEFMLDGELIIPSASAVVRRAAAAASIPPKADPQARGGDAGRADGVRPVESRANRSLERALGETPAGLEKLLQRRTRRRPATLADDRDRGARIGWLERSGGALDGVIAKRLDQPYRPASGR